MGRTARSRAEEVGITPLDLLDLPLPLRKLLILLLRRREMSYEELQAATTQFGPEERLNSTELEAALAGLMERGWLLRQGEHYRVHFRRLDRHIPAESLWRTVEQPNPTAPPPIDD
ncbi:MAG: hypothetical protein H0T73_07540 [Ardenticatenales bacterium]|nr:hypothetical protein [Ardenticatenales bacterium]